MRLPPVDFRRLKLESALRRPSKVDARWFGAPSPPGDTLAHFLERLPRILAGNEFRAAVDRIVAARRRDRPVIAGLGAHVIKVGLSPVLIDLMDRGVITCLAMHGATLIHDVEIAMMGRTSEDVEAGLDRGRFGMARETAEFIHAAVNRGARRGLGMGEAVGRALLSARVRFPHLSLLASAARHRLPATVHVALGTDIVHMHPAMDGARTGAASQRDFKTFIAVVACLEGGVYANIGSAVILPEVFLKAVSAARNLGYRVRNFTTLNLDFQAHYRPMTNVVRRPVQRAGRGIALFGHHEILLPLLAAAVTERLASLPAVRPK